MKKMMMIAMMILTAACCFAGTYTITLISKVEKVDAQYVIRNAETGAIGESVIYSTDEIAKQDVRTSFDVIQSCYSNGIQNVAFTVSATELKANVGGRAYSTDGVSIVMDGKVFGSTVSFARQTSGVVSAGATVASFEVVWPTSADLVDATYQANVTLATAAL